MIRIDRNIDIAPFTTFGISAKAAALAQYDTADELISLLSDDSLPRPFKHIGSGSNLLFVSDFKGTLIHCGNRAAYFSKPSDGELTVNASAGFVMDKLCLVAASKGYWGLENLSGIPGEVGASAVQNVGAYGVEAGDLIKFVHAIDTVDKTERVFSRHELNFAYRDSFFKHPDNRDRYFITEVSFALSATPAPKLDYAHLGAIVSDKARGKEITPIMVREAVIEMRDTKLPNPAKIGSAGSFFKNPVVDIDIFNRIVAQNPDASVPHYILPDNKVKIPAAWLIDQAGFKGRQIGGAGVWQNQPLVIANISGNASAADVTALESEIIETIKSRFGIQLHPEVEHIF